MAGVTPEQIYQALTGVGASTTAAIGIMANMINESSLNPEAINNSDPNGGSYGLVQQNGSQYASLVTGNPAADMAAQIKVLAQNGGIGAASGSTGAIAAGNFAANYERCQGCQPGGAQYSSRVANAATVEGWVTSGNWPQSAGSASAAAGGQSATLTAAYSSANCLVGFGGIFGLGSFCLVTKSEARALIGGLLLISATGVGMLAAVILAAAAFRKTDGLSKAADVAAVVPGGEAVAAGLMVAHSRATRTGASVSRSAQRKPAARSSSSSSNSGQSGRKSSSGTAAGRDLSEADRAAMRARADQISTRVEPS